MKTLLVLAFSFVSMTAFAQGCHCGGGGVAAGTGPGVGRTAGGIYNAGYGGGGGQPVGIGGGNYDGGYNGGLGGPGFSS